METWLRPTHRQSLPSLHSSSASAGLLLDLLRSLTDDDWHRPTPCPEWNVLGLSCHLLGDDLGLLARRRDQYMGTPSPGNLSEEDFINWIDELQAEWVRAARRLSPRLVVELPAWAGSRLVDTLAGEELTSAVCQRFVGRL